MRLFTRTLLQGLHDGLVENGGMPPFPSDKLASAIFDEIAATYELPPYLEQRLDKTAAVTLARAIVQHSEKLAAVGAVAPPERVALVKQASQRDLGERAMVVASYYMQKAADEGSLTPSGPNTLAAAAAHDQIAAVDQTNRPDGRYAVPIGTTDMPVPGVIGREMSAPGAPTVGATYKGADIVDPARLEAMKDWFARQGNAVADGVRNIPGALREGARQVHEYGQDLAMSPQNHMRGIADAEFVRHSDPGNAAQRAAMEAAQAHHLNRIQAQAALGTIGALGLGYGAYRGGKALYDHLTDKEASLKLAYGMGAGDAFGDMDHFGGSGNGYGTFPGSDALAQQGTLTRNKPSGFLPEGSVPAGYRTEANARAHAAVQADARALAEQAAARGPASRAAMEAARPPHPESAAARGTLWQSIVRHAKGYKDLVAQNHVGAFRDAHKGLSDMAAVPNFGHAGAEGAAHSIAGHQGLIDKRNTALKGMGAQLGTGVAALGLGYGAYRGGKALYDHLTEDGKESRASDASIDAIIQSLQDHGVEVTPEIVAAVHAELEGGATEGPSPDAETKQANAPGTFMHALTSHPLDTLQRVREAGKSIAAPGAMSAEALQALQKARYADMLGLGAQVGGVGLGLVGAKALYDGVSGKSDAPGGGHYGHASEAAHWNAVLKAAGEGSLVPTEANTLANAAKHDQIAATDQTNRPEGKYKVTKGQSALSTAAGEVGAEKKAAEAAYWANVKQAAAEWGAYLPAAMPLEMKRTAIEKVASLPPSQREQFIRALHG